LFHNGEVLLRQAALGVIVAGGDSTILVEDAELNGKTIIHFRFDPRTGDDCNFSILLIPQYVEQAFVNLEEDLGQVLVSRLDSPKPGV
jgi:hypothetical protein